MSRKHVKPCQEVEVSSKGQRTTQLLLCWRRIQKVPAQVECSQSHHSKMAVSLFFNTSYLSTATCPSLSGIYGQSKRSVHAMGQMGLLQLSWVHRDAIVP